MFCNNITKDVQKKKKNTITKPGQHKRIYSASQAGRGMAKAVRLYLAEVVSPTNGR